MQNKLWQDWVILFAAAWLFVSPFFLGFADESRAATWFALVSALSPWFMDYTAHTVATINALVVGIAVAACTASAYVRDLREAVHGHHWTAHA